MTSTLAQEMPRAPKAYSYTRFSTPEQAMGNSLKRQTDKALKWATDNGIELDTELTLHDAGISAFRGLNTEPGSALATFLHAVQNGDVPQGSWLIVENLDRISRQTVRKAVRTLEAIVEAGVNLVDLDDGGRVYNTHTLDTDDMAFLVMALSVVRVFETDGGLI